MLERITTVLIKPHFIAKYLTEKIYKSLIYFFIMLLVALLPTICFLSNGLAVSSDEYTLMEDSIRESKGSLVIENGKIINNNFYITTDLYHYAFSADDYYQSKFNVIIEDNNYTIYAYGLKVSKGEIAFDNLNVSKDASIDDISLLTKKLYNIVYDNNFNIVSAYVIVNSILFILKSLVILVIFYFLGSLINPMVKGRFKWTIDLYAMIPYFLFTAFEGFLGYSILNLIGLLYSYFAYSRALKAIVKIEVRKGE